MAAPMFAFPDSADLQKKLFSSIQLIGGGARMAGVVDFMEERVLQSIPGHIDVDTVEVRRLAFWRF
jgi:hypothetical protein